jgi:predicted PurR-regulated permease PerM
VAEEKSERNRQVREVAETAAVAASEATWPQTRAILRIIFIIIAVVATLWILYMLQGVLVLVVLAIFFAYLIAPLVDLVSRPFKIKGRERVMPRALAIGTVYLIVFGSLGLITWVLLPQIGEQMADITKQAPAYLKDARARAESLNEIYRRLNLPPAIRDAANKGVARVFDEAGGYVTGQGFQGVLALLAYIPWLILVPILAFFLLKDADNFRRSALQMLPQGRLRWRGDEFFQDINGTLAAYIRAQLFACLIIGVICTLGFLLLGVPYALVLGLIAGLLEFIPLVGPLFVALIAATFASFDSATEAILVVIFLGVLRIVQDYVIYPRIIGSGIHLHPLAVILAILAGHELAGVTGIFLAIPVTAIITVTYRHWLEHKGSTGLVAELLKPVEQVVTAPASSDNRAPAPVPVEQTSAATIPTVTSRPAPTDA